MSISLYIEDAVLSQRQKIIDINLITTMYHSQQLYKKKVAFKV